MARVGDRLLGLPDKHVTSVVDDFDHMIMLNAPSVQSIVGEPLRLDVSDQKRNPYSASENFAP